MITSLGLLFLSTFAANAQQAYRGGEGDGYASATAKNVTLGINGEVIKPEIDFSIYPNPAAENQAISLEIKEDNCELRIYSLEGRLIYTARIHQKHIKLPLLSAGTYMVKVENAELFSVRKLIVLP